MWPLDAMKPEFCESADSSLRIHQYAVALASTGDTNQTEEPNVGNALELEAGFN